MIRALAQAIFAVALFHSCCAQAPGVLKCEPPNWWIGMKMNGIQLMVYGEHLADIAASSSSPDLRIRRTLTAPNPAYAFIDIEVSASAAPGDYAITLKNPHGATSFQFPLRRRVQSPDAHQGFDCSDVIYLIAPDRFANGDTTNDTVPGMDDALQRTDPFGRHGGDLQGIIQRLEYLKDLGVTALWLMPVVENNMRRGSYHGYGATDAYRIDPRFGTNMLYAELVRQAHNRGLKVIMDHVNNHIGIRHPWITNLPMPDWLNGTVEKHEKPFHSKVELDDIHSDSLTKERAVIGWFDDRLADLNQANPFVASYLTQSTVWWIEFSGIDGIREDTFPYLDPEFRERWCRAVLEEYPRFNIVGEVWVEDPALLAPYQRGSTVARTTKPELPSLTDFGLYDALRRSFVDSLGTIDNVFACLAKDFLYPRPENLVTFLDNHDIRRIMSSVNGDVKRFKLALLTLLTTRGIPQLLYGTEIGMKGGPDHGRLRADFPGGFPHDGRDAFAAEGRTPQEDSLFMFTRQLLHLRKEFRSLQCGTLVHFRPSAEIYVFFRILDQERCLVIINHSREAKAVSLAPYAHQLRGAARLRDLMSGKEYEPAGSLTMDGMTGGIFEILSD
jgi:neopullulanase